MTKLEAAIARLGGAVDRLEDQAVGLLEELVGRRLADRADDPAILCAPLVRGAGIRLQDVRVDPGPVEAPTVEVDPQAAFVALAEQVGSYTVAAREHPEVWAAAVAAADLNGSTDDDPGEEVARLVEQKMAEYGVSSADASYWVMDERPDLWHRARGVQR